MWHVRFWPFIRSPVRSLGNHTSLRQFIEEKNDKWKKNYGKLWQYEAVSRSCYRGTSHKRPPLMSGLSGRLWEVVAQGGSTVLPPLVQPPNSLRQQRQCSCLVFQGCPHLRVWHLVICLGFSDFKFACRLWVLQKRAVHIHASSL